MSLAGRLLRSVGGEGGSVTSAARTLGRAAFVRRTQAAAAWARSELTIEVAPDVRVDPRVQVRFRPGTSNVLRIGEGSVIEDGVRILLKGGTVELGPDVDVRSNVVMNVAGHLSCEGDNLLSWGVVIHCANHVVLGRRTIVGEWATIVDSSHYFTAPDDPVYHNVRLGTVDVGSNTWIAAKATLGRGAKVGDHCIVAASSVVTGEVPDGHLASGVPVTTTRPLDLPWHGSPSD